MELLVSASFIAAFLAGVAALFAPCCVTVLLPTYFASIFKQKTTVFLMTFIYFLGLLTVFLPIGLGATAVSQLFSAYHNTIFVLGGTFLVFLGMTLVLGMTFALPFTVHPELKGTGLGSVYILGIFSGIATTCCAPVLAGVLTLAAMPGSFLLGAAYTLSYVLGMVLPLFILAAFLDKSNLTKKFFAFRKTVSYNVLGYNIKLMMSNLFSGVMYLILGVVILYLARTRQLTTHNSYQVSLNIYLTQLIRSISQYTKYLPEPIWALIFIALFVGIVYLAYRQFKSSVISNSDPKEN